LIVELTGQYMANSIKDFRAADSRQQWSTHGIIHSKLQAHSLPGQKPEGNYHYNIRSVQSLAGKAWPSRHGKLTSINAVAPQHVS